ncbi:MAG: hypothetical protein P8Q36_12755 [Alphaproteobacteria bacterium]|nr:hypothetical protein [Rhodospirillaceae bacterium]MDG2481722.1 hypothetical protein [Alphaproteobacteria bacterium]
MAEKFGAIVSALQTATGSDLTGTVGVTEGADDVEDAIQKLIDIIEENPAQVGSED